MGTLGSRGLLPPRGHFNHRAKYKDNGLSAFLSNSRKVTLVWKIPTYTVPFLTTGVYPVHVPTLPQLTLGQAAEAVRTRQVSPVELTKQCLTKIQFLDLEMNAFIAVAHDLAMVQARAAEKEITSGNYRGPLHGIPIALKDLIDVEAERTTAATGVFADHVASKDAEVTRRLRKAGAIFLGKTN